MAYRVEILGSSLTPITRVQNLVDLNKSGEKLRYTSRLSDYGSASFRVGTHDPLFDQYGDILQPYANHIRIYRSDIVVWQGIIVNCPRRNKNFIEVEAYTYEYLLEKVLLRHDPADGRGADNFRTFNSGTMATSIQTILTEAKADAGNILSNLKIGKIENPNFPQGFVDFQNNSIAGQTWAWSTNFNIKYDYRDILYVLKSFGVYAISDFNIVYSYSDNSLTFNFQKFLGNRQPDLIFELNGGYGAIDDYDIPLNGGSMANYVVGVAADTQYNILHVDQSDTSSISKYGKIAAVAAYSDVKNKNALTARVAEEITQSSTPDSEANIILNNRAYPLGVYGVGDIVTTRIKNHIIKFDQQRRVVGIDVSAHGTGHEKIRLITNRPRPEQG